MEFLIKNLFDYFDWCLAILSSMNRYHLLEIYASFLIIDGPRYILSKIVMSLWDFYKELRLIIFKQENRSAIEQEIFANGPNAPFISIICPGKNEAHCMPAAIRSLLKQKYENFEIIVIDDGSTDNTWDAIKEFITHPKVRLYRRQMAGGKSSAANMGLKIAIKGDIIIIVDSDSGYDENALSEIVKPFYDPRVGGVAGDIRVRNWRVNLITRFQAADYLHSISLGRRFTSWIGTLAICSGAFSAFRRSAVEAVGGWDVGPGEDGDLTIKIRKIGYKIKFAPKSICYTDVPETWHGWWKQRRRWNRGMVRYKMRKHLDMAIPGSSSFSFTNMLAILDVLYFRIFLCYTFFIYFIGAFFLTPVYAPLIIGLTFIAYSIANLLIICVQMFYSDKQAEDFEILLSSLIMYPYRIFQRIIRIISINEELFFRKSYEDPYIPKRVGKATIHW